MPADDYVGHFGVTVAVTSFAVSGLCGHQHIVDMLI